MSIAMRRTGAAAVLALPVVVWTADQLRMRAERADEVGIVSEWGRDKLISQLDAIGSSTALFDAVGWLALAASVITVPAVVALWWVARDRSERWAFAGLLLGCAFAYGQVVHLVGYFGMYAAAARLDDPAAATDLLLEAERSALLLSAFVPYLVGFVLAFPVLAVALRRARVLRTWHLAAVMVGTATMAVLGSTPLATTVWALGLLVGMFPAAHRVWSGEDVAGSAVDEIDPGDVVTTAGGRLGGPVQRRAR